MKTYRVDFKPISSYFFGNEKTFPYPGQETGQHLSNAYYIKSERAPSQTTILGALRYLFLAHKRNDYSYSDQEFSENTARVGSESFDITRKEEQDFGIIHRISPIFLYREGDGILIPTPFDHNTESQSDKYQPFESYSVVETPDGAKLYTSDYNSKSRLTDCYMTLNTQTLVPCDRIFSFEDRTGIATDKTQNAFFKKRYVALKNGYCFSTYLTLSDDGAVDALKSSSSGTISVFMGQGKSVFLVSFTEEENTVQAKASAMLKRKLPLDGEALYFMGDTVIPQSSALYEKTVFSVIKTKDYRAFRIAYENSENGKRGSFRKESTLYKMIAAGSILITPSANDVLNLIKNPNAQKIGLNQIVKG